jgi:hypothetical protein
MRHLSHLTTPIILLFCLVSLAAHVVVIDLACFDPSAEQSVDVEHLRFHQVGDDVVVPVFAPAAVPVLVGLKLIAFKIRDFSRSLNPLVPPPENA